MEPKQKLIDNIIIQKTIGYGSEAKVRLVSVNERTYAAKIYTGNFNDQDQQKRMMNEIQILKKLKGNPNIVEYFQEMRQIKQIKKNGRSVYIDCILLEYCENGSLFDWIESTGTFSEILTRSLFHQLLQGIEYMHSQSIYHFDLKPENILINTNYCIKITDFGLAQNISDNCIDLKINKNYLNKTVYDAPELYENNVKNLAAIDIFSLGVILFITITGHLPFQEASIKNKHYQLIQNNQFSQFWQMHQRNKEKQNFFSLELQDFLQQLFQSSPEKRLNIQQIKQHVWYNQNILSQKEIQDEFEKRKQQFSLYKEEQLIQKIYQKQGKLKLSFQNQENIQSTYW